MSFIKSKITTLTIAATIGIFALFLTPAGVAANVAPPDGGGGTLATPSCNQTVFTFPAWYRGVVDTTTCDIKIVNISDFIKIPLNILEILIQLVAYAAVIFIIWGGIRYTKSQGDPSQLTAAKGTITNAVAGLAIALASVAIVQFISGRFTQ